MLVLDDFLINTGKHKPQPSIALLEHYHLIIDGVLEPGDNLQVPSSRDKAIGKCLGLEIRCRSCPLRGMQQLLPRIDSQYRQAISLELTATATTPRLISLAQELATIQADSEKYAAVQNLLNLAHKTEWAPLYVPQSLYLHSHWLTLTPLQQLDTWPHSLRLGQGCARDPLVCWRSSTLPRY